MCEDLEVNEGKLFPLAGGLVTRTQNDSNWKTNQRGDEENFIFIQ